MFHGVLHQFGSGLEAKLRHDGVFVESNGTRGDIQNVRRLLHHFSIGQQLEHFALARSFMGNHFHLLLEIPDREVALGALSDEDVLARLDVFRDELSTRLLLGELEMCRENGNVAGVARIAERVRARLFDLSAFMKELKLRMTLAYNYASGRTGAL